MKLVSLAHAAVLAVSAAGGVCAAEPVKPAGQQAEQVAPKSTADMRAELYARLTASTDSDETEALVGLLLASYAQTGSDSGDLLLQRAHKAITAQNYGAAGRILDAAVAFMPDRAAAWNARATLRYLNDDYDGSMADIAETLKREPRHLGALMGMARILEARDKRKDALEVCQRALSIAPHWKTVQEEVDKLKAQIAGQEL